MPDRQLLAELSPARAELLGASVELGCVEEQALLSANEHGILPSICPKEHEHRHGQSQIIVSVRRRFRYSCHSEGCLPRQVPSKTLTVQVQGIFPSKRTHQRHLNPTEPFQMIFFLSSHHAARSNDDTSESPSSHGGIVGFRAISSS